MEQREKGEKKKQPSFLAKSCLLVSQKNLFFFIYRGTYNTSFQYFSKPISQKIETDFMRCLRDGSGEGDPVGATLEQGTVTLEQGTVMLEQGTVMLEQGTVMLEQGTVMLEQGTVMLEHGADRQEQGPVMLEQ
jgi:hypothetical protein